MAPVFPSCLVSKVWRGLAICLMLMLMLHARVAHAVEPFVIKDIRIEGIQRTDPGTVFGALPFRIGDTYTDEKGATGLTCSLTRSSRMSRSTSRSFKKVWFCP